MPAVHDTCVQCLALPNKKRDKLRRGMANHQPRKNKNKKRKGTLRREKVTPAYRKGLPFEFSTNQVFPFVMVFWEGKAP